MEQRLCRALDPTLRPDEYIEQNTDDEFSHQEFLNAFLVKMRKDPVNLERFRTLPSSPAAPVQIPRLTNLMHLNVDTSWYLKFLTETGLFAGQSQEFFNELFRLAADADGTGR